MRLAALLAFVAALGGCTGAGSERAASCTAAGTIPLTIQAARGARHFCVEVARTVDEQARGLMFRTDVPADGGMLFAPYPADGGPPKEASFWMENTPSALDILFVRADGTVARIAENAVPYDRTPIASGEPVAAVLELRGGRAGELGIAEGDRVRWQVEGGVPRR